MDEKVIELCGFTFVANFDSANLSRVEFVPKKPIATSVSQPKTSHKKQQANNRFMQKRLKTALLEFPDYEFNIWTNPDCSGTEFENSNRTWFYFGVRGGTPFSLVKLNIVDLNKQSKMYSQGMAPVFKILPGRNQWERIHDKPVFTSENNVFTLSFKFRALENNKATIYFAFTYPFSYVELQNYLSSIDDVMSQPENHLPKTEIRFNKGLKITNDINDAIYYHRETLCYSLEYRNVDLITISSHHNITAEREPRIDKLFPDESVPRPFKFHDKKVIFLSARVHPGETPSSFVFNGVLNLLIQKEDPIAILLRRLYVFKLIPMLNPDGVARGHYRTDTRGCNLNRFYLNPSLELHPSIYAARALIRYHHFGAEVPDEIIKRKSTDESSQVDPIELRYSDALSSDIERQYNCKAGPCQREIFLPHVNNLSSELELTTSVETSCKLSTENSEEHGDTQMKDFSITEFSNSSNLMVDKNIFASVEDMRSLMKYVGNKISDEDPKRTKIKNESIFREKSDRFNCKTKLRTCRGLNRVESGLFLYIDMHGHASKKGIFMYGNHFNKIEESVECMLLPKIMSVNSQNFHFAACNFTEKNMYLRDKRDGTSREGSGRVAVSRITGLIRSYTLECNYNTGRFVNTLPQCARELPNKTNTNLIAPPKYTPVVFEEIGRALGISILDLTNSNPWSRIPNSEYHTIFGVRDFLRLKTLSDSFLYQRGSQRSSTRSRNAKSSQTQVKMRVLTPERKLLPNIRLTPLHCKQKIEGENNPEDSERKENMTTFQGTSKSSMQIVRKQSGTSKRSINRASNILQIHRSTASRSLRSLGGTLKKSNYRASTSTEIAKFKQFTHKSDLSNEDHPVLETEGRLTLSKVSLGLNCERGKIQPLSDTCVFKQGTKRLKISKIEGDGNKMKISDIAIPGTSSSDLVVYSKISLPLSNPLSSVSEKYGHGKKRILKIRSQLLPTKYKKSLELRRGSEANRKKIKTLFKKAGKMVLAASDSKRIEAKRRKN